MPRALPNVDDLFEAPPPAPPPASQPAASTDALPTNYQAGAAFVKQMQGDQRAAALPNVDDLLEAPASTPAAAPAPSPSTPASAAPAPAAEPQDAPPVMSADESVPQPDGFLESMKQALYPTKHLNERYEYLPDWLMMPEFRHLSKNATMAVLGTLVAGADDTKKIIKEQFPNVEVHQDGRYLLMKSKEDGQTYAWKPGMRYTDFGRLGLMSGVTGLAGLGGSALAAGGAAAFPAAAALVPAAPAGLAGTPLTGAASAAGGATLLEGLKSAAGGEFNPYQVPLAAAFGAAAPIAAKVVGKVAGAAGGAAGRVARAVANDVGGWFGQGAPEAEAAAQAAAAPAAASTAGETASAASAGTGAAPPAPEAAPAAAAAAANATPDDVMQMFVRAVKGDKDTTAKFVELLGRDPERAAAAARQGFLEDLKASPDILATDSRGIEAIQAAKSLPGSTLKQAQDQGLRNIGKRILDLVQENGGSLDRSVVDSAILGHYDNEISALAKQAKDAYEALDAAVPKTTPAAASNALAAIDQLAAENGGVRNLPSDLRMIRGQLSPGEGKQPTLGLLGSLKRRINESLEGSGPFTSADKRSLSMVSSALADDESAAYQAAGRGDEHTAAKALVAQRKGARGPGGLALRQAAGRPTVRLDDPQDGLGVLGAFEGERVAVQEGRQRNPGAVPGGSCHDLAHQRVRQELAGEAQSITPCRAGA